MFVRRDHVDAAREPGFIEVGHGVAGAAVHDHGVRQVFRLHVRRERREVGVAIEHWRRVGPDHGLGEDHAPRARDGPHAQVEVALLQQPRARRLHLGEEGLADVAGADEADRERLRGQVETGVHRAQCPACIGGVDGDRDVALRRALRDEANVHVRASERAEQLRGDPGCARHAVADHGQRGDAARDRDVGDLAAAQFAGEGLEHRVSRCVGVTFPDHAADRVLGRSLRDHHHRHARLLQRCERALGGAGHADHAGPFEVQDRESRERRDALDRLREVSFRRDARARVRRVEGVARDDRDAAFDRGRHRLRVQDLGAEVREFAGFGVRQSRDLHGFGYEPGVGRQHAVDVAPDVQLLGVEQGGEDRARVVAAVPAQRRDAPVAGARDEAGHDRARRHRREVVGGARVREVPLHDGTELGLVDDEHFTRVEPAARSPAPADGGVDHRRGPDLAESRHEVLQVGRDGADQRLRVQQVVQRLELRLQPSENGFGLAGEQRLRRRRVPLGERGEGRGPAVVLGGRELDEIDEGVGDALHGGDDDDLAFHTRQQDVGHARDALRIGDAAASELVGDHAVSLCGSSRKFRCTLSSEISVASRRLAGDA